MINMMKEHILAVEALEIEKDSTVQMVVDLHKKIDTLKDRLSDVTADAVIEYGKQFLGTPYLFGSTAFNTKTFDCSDLMQYIFASQDIALPRRSDKQGEQGVHVDLADIKRGDLLFFNFGSRGEGVPDHVAVYIGENQMLHSFPERGVEIVPFSTTRYIFARRIINIE